MILTFAEFVVVWLFVCAVSWTLILRVMASNGARLRLNARPRLTPDDLTRGERAAGRSG